MTSNQATFSSTGKEGLIEGLTTIFRPFLPPPSERKIAHRHVIVTHCYDVTVTNADRICTNPLPLGGVHFGLNKLRYRQKDCKISKSVTQAYFFTGFPASIESGISETLSLGGKFLSLAENPFIFMGEIWNFP